MKRRVVMNISSDFVKIHMEMAKYYINFSDNGSKVLVANSLLQLSSLSDWRELRSALIVKCVFNSCLSYTAIVLNVRTMYPMQKASPLPKNLTTLCQVLLLLKLEFSFICGCYFIRFLGIHLHLRDQELVIGKRVVTVVISIYGCKEQHLLFAILRCYCSLKHQEEFLQKSPNS